MKRESRMPTAQTNAPHDRGFTECHPRPWSDNELTKAAAYNAGCSNASSFFSNRFARAVSVRRHTLLPRWTKVRVLFSILVLHSFTGMKSGPIFSSGPLFASRSSISSPHVADSELWFSSRAPGRRKKARHHHTHLQCVCIASAFATTPGTRPQNLCTQ